MHSTPATDGPAGDPGRSPDRRPHRGAAAGAGWLVAVVAMLLLAGCSGSGSDPSPGPGPTTGGSVPGSTIPASDGTGGTGTTIDRAAGPDGGAAPLTGTVWVVQPASLGIPVPPGATLAVKFAADGSVYARGVCNSIAGTFQATGSSLLVTRLGATEVACGGNDAEAGLMAVLTATRTYDAAGANLVLKDDKGRILLRLEAGDPALIPVG